MHEQFVVPCPPCQIAPFPQLASEIPDQIEYLCHVLSPRIL
jgi:hypothetical protein